MIQNIINAKDGPAIIKIFKDIILKAYGEKSPDGRRLIKTDEVRAAFSQTEAYSQIYMRLSTNAEEATKFVNGIVPEKYSKKKLQLPE